MYFLDTDILIRQLLPPHWRYKGKLYFVYALVKPIKILLADFNNYRKAAKSKINLTPQTMIVEHKIEQITGLRYGVFLTDEPNPNHFNVFVPSSAILHEKEIESFLRKIIPAGRKYNLIFY